MDIFLLYVWTRLDSIVALAWVAAIAHAVSIAGMVVYWLGNKEMSVHGDKYEENAIAAKMALSKAIKYAALPVIMLILIPSQKDAAIIAGGWAVKQIATSEGAQQLSSKTFDLINGRLDQELEKLNTKGKK